MDTHIIEVSDLPDSIEIPDTLTWRELCALVRKPLIFGGTLDMAITEIPADQTPLALANAGEAMNLEANGPELNPSPQAWMRAGIATSQILRTVSYGSMSLPMLVCSIAGNAEPTWDDSTPERAKLIGEHVSYEHEWATGDPA